MHDKSVSEIEGLPASVVGFLEYFEGNPERDEPAVATWVRVLDETAGFAALHFIDARPWLIWGQLALAPHTGLLEIRQLSIAPWKHYGEIDGRVLRKVRPAQLRAAALAMIRMEGTEPLVYFGGKHERPVEVFPAAEQPMRERLVEATDAPKKRGRPGRPDSHYREIALAYLESYESGTTHGILGKLADRHKVPRQTMRDWVARARKLEYLGRGTQGRPGATPGRRLLRELAESAGDIAEQP